MWCTRAKKGCLGTNYLPLKYLFLNFNQTADIHTYVHTYIHSKINMSHVDYRPVT